MRRYEANDFTAVIRAAISRFTELYVTGDIYRILEHRRSGINEEGILRLRREIAQGWRQYGPTGLEAFLDYETLQGHQQNELGESVYSDAWYCLKRDVFSVIEVVTKSGMRQTEGEGAPQSEHSPERGL